MGVLSPFREGHPLAWLPDDHPLQSRAALHVGLNIGLCGCLTTCTLNEFLIMYCGVVDLLCSQLFRLIVASWNTQMVVMIDGTGTDFGPQVAAAIFGYILGISCTVSSFMFGRHVFEWLQSCHPTCRVPSIEDGERARNSNNCRRDTNAIDWPWGRSMLVVVIASLFFAFAWGDAFESILFYREMWITALLSPLGALIRWKLSELNTMNVRWAGMKWFPWGTFVANFIASILSVLALAMESRLKDISDPSYAWLSPSLRASEAGFAGSLSTVSTLVREMLYLETPGQTNGYCLITIVCSMLFSLLVYSPIIRSG